MLDERNNAVILSSDGAARLSPDAKVNNDVAKLSDHIIICGLHNLGFRVLELLLEAQVGVVVVDAAPDSNFADLALARNVPLIRQDSRSELALQRAGVERAAALIAVGDNDLHNLETVLAAHELNPLIRHVTRIYSPQIGERMIKSIPNARALNVAKLTAPTFVTAALSSQSQILHLFEIGPEEFAVVQDRASSKGILQDLYGQDVSPLMRQSNGDKPQICPRPNTPLEQDDLVTVAGRINDLVRLEEVKLSQQDVEQARRERKGRPEPRPTSRMQRRKLRRQRVFLTPAAFLRDMDRPFRITLVAIGLVVLVSTLFFLIFNHDKVQTGNPLTDFIAALYFTMTAINSNASVSDMPGWYNQLYSVILIVVGTSLLGVTYGYVTNFIVTARLNQLLGKQEATRMEDHVVVCGLGNVGFEVARGLAERGEAVAVLELDDNKRYNSPIRAMGIPVLHADMRNPESLDLVNISKARCLAIMRGNDQANLETALLALEKNPKLLVVLRMFDSRLAGRVEKTLSIQTARSTSTLAAPYFVGAALDFKVVTAFYVGQIPFFVAEIAIEEGGALNGMTIRDLYRRRGVAVLAYIGDTKVVQNKLEGSFATRQNTPTYNPGPDFILHAGDTIYFVASHERISSIYSLNRPS